jgi:hypothetical protein
MDLTGLPLRDRTEPRLSLRPRLVMDQQSGGRGNGEQEQNRAGRDQDSPLRRRYRELSLGLWFLL